MSEKFETISEENFFQKMRRVADEEEEVKRIARQILEGTNY
jgi:AmiR/NasT family two-component response regulator